MNRNVKRDCVKIAEYACVWEHCGHVMETISGAFIFKKLCKAQLTYSFITKKNYKTLTFNLILDAYGFINC